MPTPVQLVYGEEYIVELGDGATPTEVFTKIGLINVSSNFSGTAATETAEVVDLDNLSAPAEVYRRVKSTDTKIEASGMIHAPAVLPMWTWFKSGAAKNMKFRLARTSVLGGIVHSGSFVLTAFETGGERANASECTMTFEQAKGGTIIAATP